MLNLVTKLALKFVMESGVLFCQPGKPEPEQRMMLKPDSAAVVSAQFNVLVVVFVTAAVKVERAVMDAAAYEVAGLITLGTL